MKRRLLLAGLKAAGFLILALLLFSHVQTLRRGELPFSVAAQFQGSGGTAYVQISCFFAAPQSDSSMEDARAEISAELERAYGEMPAMKMAWGSFSSGVAEAGAHVSAAEVYRVSEDFFSLHPWPQVSGSSRYPDDGTAVLNEAAAWELYGSSDCAGLSFRLDGVSYTVRGVCETPGDGSQIYLSGTETGAVFCELLLPERFRGFGEGLAAAALPGASTVNNTERPRPAALWESALAALRGDGDDASLPAWERSVLNTVLRLQLTAALLLVVLLHLLGVLLCLFLRWKTLRTPPPVPATAERV